MAAKIHTTVKEGVANLQEFFFTISVYVRGLTGPVRIKFDQMVISDYTSSCFSLQASIKTVNSIILYLIHQNMEQSLKHLVEILVGL